MNAATAGGGVRLLADGNRVPVLSLGVWQVPDGRECVEAVRWALEAYSPLGTGRYVADAAVAKIARQTGRTPAQVLLRCGTTGRTTPCP